MKPYDALKPFYCPNLNPDLRFMTSPPYLVKVVAVCLNLLFLMCFVRALVTPAVMCVKAPCESVQIDNGS